jgi:chromosome segregation ATPase
VQRAKERRKDRRMTVPFVIEALLVARRACRDGAFERARQCRAEMQTAEAARTTIEQRLSRTLALRADCVTRLARLARDGADPEPEHGHIAEHVAMLGARADDIRIELSRAEHALAVSRAQAEEAIAFLTRAQKRLDAALERKAVWELESSNAERRA